LHDFKAAGSIYGMDRGYIDDKRLFALNEAGAFFVTRAKLTMHAPRVCTALTDQAIATNVLIAFVKKELEINASPALF